MSLKRSFPLILGVLVLFSLLPFSQGSPAVNPASACRSLFSGPLSYFGAPTHTRSSLPAQFRLIVWNVYKGGRWLMNQKTEFRELIERADIALLQEAIGKPDFINNLIFSRPDYCWTLANAFTSKGFSTGVATGSNVRQLQNKALLSPVTEPITNSHKSILLTEYPLQNSRQTLLVLNIHAINFVSTGSFKKHIDQARDVLKSHRGPIVMAGDFNTWNAPRMQYLLKVAQELRLAKVPVMNGSPKILKLDHVFTRGLTILSAEELSQYRSSDHSPLALELATAR